MLRGEGGGVIYGGLSLSDGGEEHGRGYGEGW